MSLPDAQVELARDKLLIKFVFQQKTGFMFGKQTSLVQGIPFEYGIEVKNIGIEPFQGAIASNIGIRSFITQIQISSQNKISLPNLNPNESKQIMVGHGTAQFEGAGFVECLLKANDVNKVIETYQLEESGNIDTYSVDNQWGDAIYIIPKMELLQSRTNNLIALLTILIFVDSLIGLRPIFNFLVQLLGDLLKFIGNLIQSLSL